jgi:hypothetical protein
VILCFLIVLDLVLRISDFASLRCGTADRQLDGKQTAATDLTIHADGPAVVADDAVTDRKSQAGALADWFGGEKRVERCAAGVPACYSNPHTRGHLLGHLLLSPYRAQFLSLPRHFRQLSRH